jgi:hypothetical protein
MALSGLGAMPCLSPECAPKRTTDPYSANFSEMIHELLPLTKTIDRLVAPKRTRSFRMPHLITLGKRALR